MSRRTARPHPGDLFLVPGRFFEDPGLEGGHTRSKLRTGVGIEQTTTACLVVVPEAGPRGPNTREIGRLDLCRGAGGLNFDDDGDDDGGDDRDEDGPPPGRSSLSVPPALRQMAFWVAHGRPT